MAKWLAQMSQWNEMNCHDLEVMSSNSGRVGLGGCVVLLSQVLLDPKLSITAEWARVAWNEKFTRHFCTQMTASLHTTSVHLPREVLYSVTLQISGTSLDISQVH